MTHQCIVELRGKVAALVQQILHGCTLCWWQSNACLAHVVQQSGPNAQRLFVKRCQLGRR